MLKLVACTKLWNNIGNAEVPMWRAVGGNEYVIHRFEEEPTFKDIGEAVNKFMHVLEGRINQGVVETYTGFELYDLTSLTHSENFQLENGGPIDFPAEDVQQYDFTEEVV